MCGLFCCQTCLLALLVTVEVNFEKFCPIPADASVNFTSSTYPVIEGDGTVQVCTSLYDVPTEGLECEIEIFLGITDGVKAGMPAIWCGFI